MPRTVAKNFFYILKPLIITQPHLVEQCQMKTLELLGVELHGQGGTISCQALQLLDEVPAVRQRDAATPPTHLDAGLWRRLLTNRGN